MTWYPKVSSVQDNGFGGSRNGQPINGVVIHHVAGTNGLRYVANANSRNSHPTYHISNSGAVTGIVNPSRRPYSTGGQPDPSAVAFEIDNSSAGGNWPVSSAAIEALIDVIVYHASQSPRAGKGFAKNLPAVKQSEFFIAWHSQYKATACPGPFIMSQLDYIVSECNKRALGVAPSAPAPVINPIEAIAREVIAGKWGNGPTRTKRLTDAGHNSKAVQAMVNQILSGKVTAAPAPAPAPAPSKPPLSGWLRRGSTGPAVRYIQGVLGIKVDGQFGPITDRSVRAFQRAHGLKIDGIVGPITYGKM
jgi:peptidoglycan hydrolase-like protein with peptidoglycan-binding domain